MDEMIHDQSISRKDLACKMHPIKMGTKGEVIKGDAIGQRSPFEDGNFWETTRRDAAFPGPSHEPSHFIPPSPEFSRAVTRLFPRFPTARGVKP
jgi:hypothetical protein